MTDTTRRDAIERLKRHHRKASGNGITYEVSGVKYNPEELALLMGEIMRSDLPRQLTNGVGIVKRRILDHGENPERYIGIIRNAHSEYTRLNSRSGENGR